MDVGVLAGSLYPETISLFLGLSSGIHSEWIYPHLKMLHVVLEDTCAKETFVTGCYLVNGTYTSESCSVISELDLDSSDWHLLMF